MGMERGSFAARHDFDALPLSPDIDVRCAQLSEIAALAQMAHRLVPGVRIGAEELTRYATLDPQSILTFSRKGHLVGGMAFLFLNDRGHDALLLDEICLTAPETHYLASAREDVAAIYIWAIAATGRGIAGLGKAAAHLRQLRFRGANCYAQPSTVAGADIMKATGFAPVPSFQPDLWCYERPWHRLPMRMPGAIIQARSIADARY
ncbi:hypothetical protein XH99_08275 [Bradyrhizobium nanningense]|uniref:N-acetyltransferase domain-containing protein n=1 Tax=Bradyrhizobium nanningense TaxID=1325118 RepID=A0A4Q0SDL7_9BRAD|nr:hypothetical protein [Bradyrhizobium nanningense]RXH35710.1 hypothetical protein XH99_08275 [Bradyrhizobium nanningense]RXH36179.1 hypothetical protein XH84_02815 [Bradyrhizobium nanningense]